MRKMISIAEFVLDQFYRYGVHHIFGVPGDYVLGLIEGFERFGRIKNVVFRTESGAAFAANIYGQTKDLGVCYATYGPGCYNVINAVCDAKLSFSSLIVLGGEIGLKSRNKDYLFHHQLEAGIFDDQQRIFRAVLGADRAISITDPKLVRQLVSQALRIVVEDKQPVYLGVPADLWNEPITTSQTEFSDIKSPSAKSDFQGALKAGKEIIGEAENPVILVGHLCQRFGFLEATKRLAEALRAPIVSAYNGRGAFPLDHSLFAGVYVGPASVPDSVRELVENSDCLIKIGVVDYDVNFGLQPPGLPNPVILIDPLNSLIRIRDLELKFYKKDNVAVFLEQLADIFVLENPVKKKYALSFSEWVKRETDYYFRNNRKTGLVKIADLVPIINRFLEGHKEFSLITDTGDAMIIGLSILSENYYSSLGYGTMEIALPGAIGLELATGKRPLVMVGDSAFSMAEAELATLANYNLRPIILILNNQGYGTLRIKQKSESFDTDFIHFENLDKVVKGKGYLVKTRKELERILEKSCKEKGFSLINIAIAKDDHSVGLQKLMGKD